MTTPTSYAQPYRVGVVTSPLTLVANTKLASTDRTATVEPATTTPAPGPRSAARTPSPRDGCIARVMRRRDEGRSTNAADRYRATPHAMRDAPTTSATADAA